MAATDWLTGLFDAIDGKDADAFAAHLDGDALFRFGNAAPVRGREAVRETVAAFFASIRSVHHAVHASWPTADGVVMHGEVTYTRHDGTALTVPFANVFVMHGELVREYRIFVDASRLYA